MNAVAKKMMAAGNRATSWLYLRTNGRIGGTARGNPVLLLTVPGRKTGKLRSVSVTFFEHDNGYLVAATAGGSKANPQWLHNLEAAGQAQIHIREDRYEVDARIADRAERDELWQKVVVKRAPSFAKYEEKSGRSIPIALLTPRV
ncbi:MAG TPA: nitroreductase family deazaflavin-dependent oxidoreductase [Acidimicrobiia bacterium]|nr:nitroreductase family deazaflavin-dependent oxidoreductase [Acidimicrobiia bacterium]